MTYADFLRTMAIRVRTKSAAADCRYTLWISKRLDDGEDEMPACFKMAGYSVLEMKLVLVINGHEIQWLPPIKDALQRELKRQTKIWRLELTVLNHELADEYGLLRH